MLEKGFVLVIDDSSMNARLAIDTLEEVGYRTVTVHNAKSGIDFVRNEHPDIVLMDIVMPGLSGYEATRILKSDKATSDTRIIIVSAKASPKDIVAGFNCHADDYLTKPYYPQVLIARVETQMLVFNAKRVLVGENTKLEKEMYRNALQLQRSYENIFFGLANLVEFRNTRAAEHMKKIGQYTRLLAIELRKTKTYSSLITDEYIEVISWAAQLHDIGKIGLPDEILQKESLTKSENETFKKHTILGGELFRSSINQIPWQPSLQLETCREIAMYHHERFDGTGYPDRLTATEIPLSARLVSLADAYEEGGDCNRCSKKEGADNEQIMACAGTHFDPTVVKAFISNIQAFKKISQNLEESLF